MGPSWDGIGRYETLGRPWQGRSPAGGSNPTTAQGSALGRPHPWSQVALPGVS